MLGQTTPGVMRVREVLIEAGREPVIFHANGVGGPAMEHLIESGALGGVIDYTLSELANSLLDGIHATGPDRLRVAGRHGVPQVVVPGLRRLLQPGTARASCPSATAGARPTSTTRWPRSFGSRATRRPSSAAWSPSA